MKKEELFSKLRANTRQQYPMPTAPVKGIRYDDPIAQFIDTTRAVGGNVLIADPGEDLSDIVSRIYPQAKVYATNLPDIHLSADLRVNNPDTIPEAADLNGTDVGIVRGTVGVAENGCVWIPQTMKEKALLFISEYLIILLDKCNVVSNMHEAYAQIEMDPRYNFGTFISGPSKTADIEQALVMGAQAARGVTVVLC